jgi:hypothetical protein
MRAPISTQVARLPRKVLSALLLAPAALLGGCADMNHTESGALTGAGLGALGGAIIGSAVRRPGVGAAIGAAAGGVTGAAIGNAEDKREERQQAQAVAAAQARALGVTDVAQMARQNVPDDIIINQIRTSPSVFQLTATDIQWLRENRVSDAVIREMQLTAMRAPRRVYVEGAVYQPVVVVDEPPPVAVGVGFYRRRW